jgi:mannose-6-phosphate isomerase-like protein (cupin superfamily)
MPIRVFEPERDGKRVILGPGVEATVVVDGAVGAHHAVMVRLRLEAGRGYVSTVPAGAEDTWYVIQGRGVVADLVTGRRQAVEPRCVIAIEPGSRVAIRATGGPMLLVGGPTPPGTPLGTAEQDHKRYLQNP